MNIFKEIPRIWRKVNRAADDVGESFKKIEEVGQAFREARGWIEDQGRYIGEIQRQIEKLPDTMKGLGPRRHSRDHPGRWQEVPDHRPGDHRHGGPGLHLPDLRAGGD